MATGLIDNGDGTFSVERRVAQTRPIPSSLVCGVARVDITPNPGIPLAGNSMNGKTAKGVGDRLYARVIYLCDPSGNRVAICALDLWSASRLLHELVAQGTAAVGISTRQLLMTGTHTHTGPGHYCGNSLYDRLAQRRRGFDVALARWLGGRIALAVRSAVDGARPATLSIGRATLWGTTHNRSLEAFQNNAYFEKWLTPDGPARTHRPGCAGRRRRSIRAW